MEVNQGTHLLEQIGNSVKVEEEEEEEEKEEKAGFEGESHGE